MYLQWAVSSVRLYCFLCYLSIQWETFKALQIAHLFHEFSGALLRMYFLHSSVGRGLLGWKRQLNDIWTKTVTPWETDEMAHVTIGIFKVIWKTGHILSLFSKVVVATDMSITDGHQQYVLRDAVGIYYWARQMSVFVYIRHFLGYFYSLLHYTADFAQPSTD